MDSASEIDGSDLLNFSSRAQILISELLLLSSRIPPQFLNRRYDPVLFDLNYFGSPDDLEAKIEGNLALEELEDELRESCGVYMQRFFLLASGIVTFYLELIKFLKDMEEGAYVLSTLERVMENGNGCQLLTESLTLFGCLLLLLEHHISGSLREKLLVAHVRNDRCFDDPNLDNICSLCRTHVPTSGPARQVHLSDSLSSMIFIPNPEDLFSRFPFPKEVVNAVIRRLCDDDLYDRLRHYPDPEHRTVALASQAGSVYIMLFYAPEMLHNGLMMREIVDRFYKDCWVVPLFIYFTVDVALSWDAYKAAKTSLSSSLSNAVIRDICQLHCTKVKELLPELESILSDGLLTRDYVLDNSQNLLSLVRKSNVSLRWLLLHRSSVEKKLRDIVTSTGTSHQVEDETVLLLLLKTSKLEYDLKQFYIELLEGKEILWKESKYHASNCMQELSEYYSGPRGLSWKIKDEPLKDFFEKLSLELHSLDYAKSGNAGRKLYYVISALKEVEQLHQNEENSQIMLRLLGIQKDLQDMLRALKLHPDTMSTFSMVTDASYAWGFIGSFSKWICERIEQDSSTVVNLHSFFLKFRSMPDVPLLRISQSDSCSPDFLSVSNYYSGEYVAGIRAVLKIIPVMLFRILNDNVVCSLQPFHLLNRIDLDSLQNTIQSDQQFHLMLAVNKISIFSKGIKVMSRAFFGLIDLDMNKWLEGEIRKELLKRLEHKLKRSFLSSSVGLEGLEAEVESLKTYLLSQLHMMECFQDIMHIKGTNIWEEEFTRILKHGAQEERDGLIRRSRGSVVTLGQLNDFSKAHTFLGHLLHRILHLTNPSRSMYIEPMSGWFDAEGRELLGLHFFDLFESCVGPVGMASLNSLLIVLIVENLGHALRGLENLLDTRCLEELQRLEDSLGPATSLPLLGWSTYKQMDKIVNTLCEPWVGSLACIGQLQLLRLLISSKLKSACKIKANKISFAIDDMMASISSQRQKMNKDVVHRQAKEENDETVELSLWELSKQGMLSGFCSPFETIYISKGSPPFLSRYASLITISQLSRYVLDAHLNALTSRLKKVALDFSPVVIGLGTFLRQFHPTFITQYVQYMGQYIRTMADTTFGAVSEPRKGSPDPASEVMKSAFWLMYFCKHMGVPKDLLDSCLPPSLISILQT